MANRNRSVGNGFEAKIAQRINRKTLSLQKGEDISEKELSNKELREISTNNFLIFPKVGTTRELSRALDSKKVDITTVVFEQREDFPYNIQAKSLCTSTAPYPKLLAESKKLNTNGIPVVFHQQTKKANTRFVVQDEFACLYLSDFIDMMFKITELENELKQRDYHNDRKYSKPDPQ